MPVFILGRGLTFPYSIANLKTATKNQRKDYLMSSIYIWEGPEKSLAVACVAARLEITSLSEDKPVKVTGAITICDYTERGILATDKWEAAANNDDQTRWDVVPVVDDKAVFFKDTQTDKPAFTMCEEINVAMAVFIGQKINGFIGRWLGSDKHTPIVDALPVYSGTMLSYTGPCVCEKLDSSRKDKPFDWQKLTQGQYPTNCFQCSCRQQWWRANPSEHLWGRIGDPAAWDLLIKHNGMMVRAWEIHPEQHTIMLLETISRSGFIPM